MALSAAMLNGELNSASSFVPSALPLVAAIPAMVLTTQFVPAGVILRMVSPPRPEPLSVSDT